MRDSSTQRVLVLAGSIFFALGMLAALGAALPEIARNNSSSLDATGAIFTALFLGAVPAQLVTGWLNERYGPGRVLAAGLLIMGAGMFGATLSRSLPLTLALMGFAGLGDGLLVVGANVMVVQVVTRRSASMINLMNVFYGVGSIAAPALVGASIGLLHTAMPALWLLSSLFVLILLGIRGLKLGSTAQAKEGESGTPISRPGTFYLSPVIWILSLLLLIYVGVEVGAGGWAATYTRSTSNLPEETAALMGSAFYLAVTTGRLIAAGLGMRLRTEHLFMGSLATALLGGLAMLLSLGNTPLTVASIMLLGVGFGPIYPTVLTVVAGLFPTTAGKAAGLVMAIGGIGGMLIPWLQGILIKNFGPQSFALTEAAGAFAMLTLFATTLLMTRRRSPVIDSSIVRYPTSH